MKTLWKWVEKSKKAQISVDSNEKRPNFRGVLPLFFVDVSVRKYWGYLTTPSKSGHISVDSNENMPIFRGSKYLKLQGKKFGECLSIYLSI
tara:strand:+ start:217 stop:489 length:273 start_codon:yes stop_codon:yes gene_type:complete